MENRQGIRRFLRLLFPCIALLLVLSGCLFQEAVAIRVDLANNTAEQTAFNIVSTESEEESIRKDFEDLLKRGEGMDDITWASGAAELVSRELYAEGGRLNERTRLAITDPDGLFAGLGIRRTADGHYVREQAAYGGLGGNGIAVIESGSKKVMVWPPETTVFEIKTSLELGGDGTGLLPYWQEWRKGKGSFTP